MIKIEFIDTLTNWSRVLNSARATVGKDPIKKESFSVSRFWNLISQKKGCKKGTIFCLEEKDPFSRAFPYKIVDI